MASTANKGRVYEAGIPPVYNDLPVAAATNIYEGSAVSWASGNVQALAGSEAVFVGFASAQADNSSGSAGDIDCRVISQGIVKLAVTGVVAGTEIGDIVYADDDDTFTLTDGTASTLAIGRVHRVIGAGEAMVAFESDSLRSLDTTEAV